MGCVHGKSTVLEVISAHNENRASQIGQDPLPPAQVYVDAGNDFTVIQMFTPCLAEMAYIILSENEAAVIDPLRETEPYIKMLHDKGCKLKYIFLTHFHADFVSGHYDLSLKTGASIVFGPTAQANIPITVGDDNEEFAIGKVKLRLIHTPGHTMESSCYLLLENERQHCIFTGDTLFLGEVGRPDLACKAGSITKEDLAGYLYDSLRNKIMKLDPKTIIYPGHGAGSPCGKKISSGTFCQLGKQMLTNYALQDMTKEDFIKELTSDLPTPPQYFFHDVTQNKGIVESVDEIVKKCLVFKPLPSLEQQRKEGIILVDSRSTLDFQESHIPGSINVPLAMNYAIWSGTLFSPQNKFFIISDKGKEQESIMRLARIGYDSIIGVLDGGLEKYKTQGLPLEGMNHIPASYLTSEMIVLDVRNPSEFASGHLENAKNLPLGQLGTLASNGSLESRIPKDQAIYVHCKSGARSTMACSILRKNGYQDIYNIDGGYDAIVAQNTNLKFIKPE